MINITGITDKHITSLGVADAKIIGNNFSIYHPFHVVPNSFHIPVDAILGKDFFKTYECIIDYNDKTLSFWLGDHKISIPIETGPQVDTIVVPARSEVIRQFKLKNYDKPKLVESQEILKGVFIARTIIDSDQPLLKILNTTNEVKTIKNNRLLTEDLSNYNVYSMNSVKNTLERKNILSKILKKNSPKHSYEKLLPLCEEFADIFALEQDEMTINNFYMQKLRISDDTPVYIKNYRLPHSQKQEIHRQVDELLKQQFIEPSTSNYNSPIIIVPKPELNGQKRWRMCLDYRQVNKKIIADRFPLPRIDDILDSLGRAKYFSVIDLFQGFHQIPLHPDSRDITSFSTDKGFYRWKVLPFGLNICPNSFSRMMSIAFAGISTEQAFLYLDDIIVIGHNEEHHLSNLRTVFEIMRNRNLKINPYKCQFYKPEVTFLGHLCTSEGILPDKSKENVIRNFPVPQDKDAARRFVAFANYYRRFIPNFSLIAKPINNLTKKDTPFEWTDECQHAFDSIKNKLIKPPILCYPNFNKEFIVTVDASKDGCGAVLSQQYGDKDLPIQYASKTFSRADKNKSTPIQECLAIYFALTQFRPYIYGKRFLVRTDHKSLIYLFSHKNPSPKLTRIRLEMEDYDFIIEHIKGRDNVAADALSRISIDDLKDLYGGTASVLPVQTRSMTQKMNKVISHEQETPDYDYSDENDNIELRVIENLTPTFIKSIPRIVSIRTSSEKDSLYFNTDLTIYKNHKKLFNIFFTNMRANDKLSYETILSRLEKSAIHYNINELQWSTNDVAHNFGSITIFKETCQNILKKIKILLINEPIIITHEEDKLKLMTDYHNNYLFGGHSGQKRLYAKLRNKFYWKNMTRDIAKFVRNCDKCQFSKVKIKNKEGLMLTPTPQKPFDVVIIDTIGPLPTSVNGNRCAVTMMCDLTKYLIIVPIPDKSATTIAKAIFEHFILIYGLLKEIRTDLGTEYINSILSELCKLLQITHNTSTAYHPQSVGTIERNHRVFNEYIRSYISENISDWETYSKYFAFCYNITNNSSLDHKYTPYELVFNKTPLFPHEFLSGNIDPIYNIDNYVYEARYRIQHAHIHAKQLIEKMKQRNKLYYDKTSKPLDIKINDKVIINNEPYDKHKPIYKGPYIVKEIKDLNLVLFDGLTNKSKLIHKDKVHKYNN